MQSGCLLSLARGRDTYRPHEGSAGVQASGVSSKRWAGGRERAVSVVLRRTLRAWARSPSFWPQSPAHPTLRHSNCTFPSSSDSEQDDYSRDPKCRETVVLIRQAYTPQHSGSRARTQAPRKARTGGGAGVPSCRSPLPDLAVSRELGVNSPEWRPEVCMQRRRRSPGPTGPELEGAAGTSLKARRPGPRSRLFASRQPARSSVSAGPEAPRVRVWSAVAGPSATLAGAAGRGAGGEGRVR